MSTKPTNDTKLGYTSKIFKQDLDAFSLAIKKHDFESANIFANRVMSNAVLHDNSKFGIVGFFLKHISSEGSYAQQNQQKISLETISKAARHFMSVVISDIKNINISDLWKELNNYNQKIRFVSSMPGEADVYTAMDINFVHESFVEIFKLFDKKKSQLTYPSNKLISGTVNELIRITKTHGSDVEILRHYSLFSMLDRIYSYIKSTSTKSDFEHRINNEFLPLVEQIPSYTQSCSDKSTQIDNNLWLLIQKWREYFIVFMELEQIQIQPVHNHPLSLGSEKEKFTEILAKNISKEIRE